MTKTKRRVKKNKKKRRKKINKKVGISSNFESGNIIHRKTENNIINLEIKEEPYPKSTRKYKNWFYFKATNINNPTVFKITKLRNYFNDWKGYKVCYSYDNKNWKS